MLLLLLLLSRLSCVRLCNPIDGSPPGSPIPGILQDRTLEWVAISFSNAWKWKVKVKSLSRVRLFVTPWIAAHQAPPSMGFFRQEYWSGLPLPSPFLPWVHLYSNLRLLLFPHKVDDQVHHLEPRPLGGLPRPCLQSHSWRRLQHSLFLACTSFLFFVF